MSAGDRDATLLFDLLDFGRPGRLDGRRRVRLLVKDGRRQLRQLGQRRRRWRAARSETAGTLLQLVERLLLFVAEQPHDLALQLLLQLIHFLLLIVRELELLLGLGGQEWRSDRRTERMHDGRREAND